MKWSTIETGKAYQSDNGLYRIYNETHSYSLWGSRPFGILLRGIATLEMAKQAASRHMVNALAGGISAGDSEATPAPDAGGPLAIRGVDPS